MLEAIFPPGSADLLIDIFFILLQIAAIVAIVMGCVAYATYFERKVIGHMQVRMGPMRVGPHGLFQPIADGIKLFFKEDIIPTNADKPVFFISPVIALIAAMASMAVLPFFKGYALADINISLLYIFALSSLASYGIVLAGWSSNSKFAFLGGLRSSAQVISYEVALGLSLVGVMIQAGSLNLGEIVEAQRTIGGTWSLKNLYIFPQIIGAVVFFIAAMAETNRTPFDLPEAESELVAGYLTEYSGFRYSIFFMAEYMGMFLMGILWATCFLGGWSGPFDHVTLWGFPIVSLGWLMLKTFVFIFIYYWIRATVPRYRYDQLMDLGWKVLIPVALLNIVIVSSIRMILKMV